MVDTVSHNQNCMVDILTTEWRLNDSFSIVMTEKFLISLDCYRDWAIKYSLFKDFDIV
jgi:hypothetical protein